MFNFLLNYVQCIISSKFYTDFPEMKEKRKKFKKSDNSASVNTSRK